MAISKTNVFNCPFFFFLIAVDDPQLCSLRLSCNCDVALARVTNDIKARDAATGSGGGGGRKGSVKGGGSSSRHPPCPTYRKQQRSAAAGQGSTRAGAHKAESEKRLAAENASLQRKLAEAQKRLAAANSATAPAAGAADAPMEGEATAG